jgi:hypothetical protein
MSWQCSSQEVILEGFKKCCICGVQCNGGTDDDILLNDSEEDGYVNSECEKDEGTDCKDGHSTNSEDGESDIDC